MDIPVKIDTAPVGFVKLTAEDGSDDLEFMRSDTVDCGSVKILERIVRIDTIRKVQKVNNAASGNVCVVHIDGERAMMVKESYGEIIKCLY